LRRLILFDAAVDWMFFFRFLIAAFNFLPPLFPLVFPDEVRFRVLA
jgi:hypothetical protein